MAGDCKPEEVKALVEKYWGGWQRGKYAPVIPVEPPQQSERRANVEWPVTTPPWLAVAYKVPAYTDTEKDTAALDLIYALAFGDTSPAYQRLVIQEQKVDVLSGGAPRRVDPALFTIYSRVKAEKDVGGIRESIVSTLNGFKDTLVDEKRLNTVKSNLRYQFALSMDNSEAIAGALAYAVALRRSPETLNRLYAMYERITPEDLRAVARKYFVENGRTIVTLSGPKAK